MSKDICGVFIAEYDTHEKADMTVKSMKNCPHLIFAGTTGNKTFLIFIVPQTLRWWFEVPAENPELLEAKNVKVFIAEKIEYPDEFDPRIPMPKTKNPPCESNCIECPMREKHNCPGCPAVVQG